MNSTDPLTTGQAAEYCHVSQATIVNWIKKGQLKAYATPGGHYRIPTADFLSFLEEYGVPVHPALAPSSQQRVLVLADGPVATQIRRAFGDNRHYDVQWARSQFEAGALVERFHPGAVLVDISATLPSCAGLCKWLHDFEKGKDIPVLAIGSPGQRKAALSSGADSFVSRSDASSRLLAELEALFGAR